MIKKVRRKVGSKTKTIYRVVSEKSGRSFGTYDTMEKAKKRLGQVEFFKHRNK